MGSRHQGRVPAQALAGAGLEVTVLERREAPASETSGNPGGLFHGTVNADDGPYARLFRAAALQAQGKDPSSLARDIEKELSKFIRDPVVTVIVTSHSSSA